MRITVWIPLKMQSTILNEAEVEEFALSNPLHGHQSCTYPTHFILVLRGQL